MAGRIIGLVLVVFFTLLGFGQDEILPAFPGAEGYGKYTTGGRGGKVIYVTNLEDNSNPGSLRYALNQSGSRIILFKVSGTIQLKSSLKITNRDVTIAGQTAPGDGITLRDYPVEVAADNVIIRFLRFRLGDETLQEADAFWGRNHKNVIIDHCSMSWSVDECASFYDNTDFTMQWCLLSESLRNSVHGKGSHGYGGIWGGKNASFHHNLLADHDSRNPRFCGSRYSNRPDLEMVDFRNNVIYNWKSNSIYAGEGGNYNIVNNYFKAGPATSSSVKARIMQPYADDGANSQPAGTYGKFYISGNYVTGSITVSNDNWQGVALHSTFQNYAVEVTLNNLKSDTEFNPPVLTTHPAQKAYEKVLDFAGASLIRDSVDARIIHDVSNGSATFADGGNGSTNGIIDTQAAVGGWPVLKSTEAPSDSDNDGMPDDWERINGLNATNNTDAQLKTVDGIYPNVEVYLASLVKNIINAQNQDGALTSALDFIEKGNTIKVFYDNSAGEIQIIHSEKIREVRVYSLTGQLLIGRNSNQPMVRINVSGLHNGIYIVRVLDDKNNFCSNKVMKF